MTDPTTPTPEQRAATFTDDQVASLNAFQEAGNFHPFTCGNPKCRRESGGELVATREGWHCPSCDYRQDWAHGFMLDWSWREEQGHE